MRIIRIVKKGQKDVTIFFDDERILILALEVFLKSGLKKGEEISDDRFSALIEQNKLFHIKQRAFRLLGRRQHSSSELKRKLWRKDYEQKLIDAVIEELKINGYLNDEDFIREFVVEKSEVKKWSLNRIKSELIKQGINLKLIEAGLKELPGNVEYEKALNLGEKKYEILIKRTADKKELKEKLFTFLYSKGFEYDVVKEVSEKILINDYD